MNEIRISIGFSEILLICATTVYLQSDNINFSFILFASAFIGAIGKFSINESYRSDNNKVIKYLSDRIDSNENDK